MLDKPTKKAKNKPKKKGPLNPVKGGKPLSGTAPGVGTHKQTDWESANAIDIGTTSGETVYAPINGTVVRIGGHDPREGIISSGTKKLYGYGITIKGSDGKLYFIAHLGGLKVRSGQKVSRGSVIAASGALGHVHYAVSGGSPWVAAGLRTPKGANATASNAAYQDGSASVSYYAGDTGSIAPVQPDQTEAPLVAELGVEGYFPSDMPIQPEELETVIGEPGSNQGSYFEPQRLAETWQLLAAQPMSSPETQLYAQNAGVIANASNVY